MNFLNLSSYVNYQPKILSTSEVLLVVVDGPGFDLGFSVTLSNKPPPEKIPPGFLSPPDLLSPPVSKPPTGSGDLSPNTLVGSLGTPTGNFSLPFSVPAISSKGMGKSVGFNIDAPKRSLGRMLTISLIPGRLQTGFCSISMKPPHNAT